MPWWLGNQPSFVLRVEDTEQMSGGVSLPVPGAWTVSVRTADGDGDGVFCARWPRLHAFLSREFALVTCGSLWCSSRVVWWDVADAWAGQKLRVFENFPSMPWTGSSVVRASSWYTKVVGSIPGQGTYKNQPMSVSISGTTNRCLFLSLPLFLSKINKLIND